MNSLESNSLSGYNGSEINNVTPRGDNKTGLEIILLYSNYLQPNITSAELIEELKFALERGDNRVLNIDTNSIQITKYNSGIYN